MSDTGRTSTVLIVDDTPENIDLLDGVLNQDYKIKVALNGEKALIIAGSENPPDIILLDIEMPGMDDMRSAGALRLIPKPGISLSSSLRLNPMNPTETAKDSGCVGGNRQAEHGESACYTNSE